MELSDDIPRRLADSDPRLPFSVPFTTAMALDYGVSKDELTTLVRTGLLRRVFSGVYVDSVVPDDTTNRARSLALIVPETAVVTDETAAWLHGVDLQPPGAFLVAPALHVFQQPGATRIRKQGCQGGERTLLPADIELVEGVRVTTPLRTASDLGRLRSRDWAMAAFDQLLRLGRFSRDELIAEAPRFRGQRGVVQFRELAPLADQRAESVAESITRIRCIDAGLPALEPQVEIRRGGGWLERAYLDLANRSLRFAVEYDGKAFHTSREQRDRDRRRRGWVSREENYGFAVLTDRHVFGVDRGVTAVVVRRKLEEHLRRSA
jgi:hypothetical protein